MNNKDVFKEMFSKRFNKDSNYKVIIDNLNNTNNNYSNYKIVIVFLSVFVLVVSLIVCKPKNFDNKVIPTNSNWSFITNNLVEKSDNISFIYKEIKESEIEDYEFLEYLSIPSDFIKKEVLEVYIKENLNNYKINYFNSDNTKRISLSFSSENNIINNYDFITEESTNINGLDLYIGKYDNILLSVFFYDRLYFEIETENISLKEFILIVSSLLK